MVKAHLSLRNRVFKGDDFCLYIDKNGNVGFGRSKYKIEEARSSVGMHNHWLKKDGKFSPKEAAKYGWNQSPVNLENK